MPIVNLRYPASRLDRNAKARLERKLADVLIKMEGGANTHGGRAFATVLFHEIPAEDCWVGGETNDTFVSPPGNSVTHVTIPEGYLNAAHKSDVYAWTTTAILEALGQKTGPRMGSSIQVILDEDGRELGAVCRTISLESNAGTVGMPMNGNRFAWVRSYFEANANQLRLFGYPNDLGGLPPSIAES